MSAVVHRLGARATALLAVAALCASLAFAFAAAALGGDRDGELTTGRAAGVGSTPVTESPPAPAPVPSTSLGGPAPTVSAPTTSAPTTAAPATTTPATTAGAAPVAAPVVAASGSPVPPPLASPTTTAEGGVTPHADRVFVFGDSVILGAAAVLPSRLPGWEVVVDAEESRFEHEAPGILAARRGDIGRVVVVLIGHNSGAGYNHETWIRRMMDELGGVERVVWLTAAEWGPGPAEFNATLRRLAPEYPSIAIADWHALNAANPSFTFDGLHLLGPGQAAMADLVAAYVGPHP